MQSKLGLEAKMNTRKAIKELIPYEVNSPKNMIRLDANESSEGMMNQFTMTLNRYPDNQASALRDKLADYLSVDKNELLLANGSSELIELLMKTYLEKGDQLLGFENSFSMYKIFSTIYEVDYVTIENDYLMDMDLLIQTAIEKQPKMVMVCNPNNPTGYLISKCDIERLLKNYDGLVVIDEAYIEFTEASMLNRLDQYENLIILRTFSKAWGLAGARVGYMVASSGVVKNVMKVKAPYSLNTLSQQAALYALENIAWMKDNVTKVIENREYVYSEMSQLGYKVYKSFANFIYFEATEELNQDLLNAGVMIRSFGSGKYRVTITRNDDYRAFLNVLGGQVLCEKVS